MYSSNSMSNHINYQHLSDDSEVNMVSANINSSRTVHESSSNEATNHIDLTIDYSNGGNLQIVNYMPSEMLHHHGQLLQGIKKLDANYMQSKDQLHVYENDASSSIITSTSIQQTQQTSLPLLTPLKYVDYHSSIGGPVNDEQMIINDESDKSDCDSGEHELQKTPSKLPHKKRIAKKLNSSQSYNHQEHFSIIMPADESNLRNMQVPNPNVFECNICGMGLIDQLQFFIHLKQHYEPPMQSLPEKRKIHEREVEDCEAEVNLVMSHRHQHVEALPEKLIASLEDSHKHIKEEELQLPIEPLPEMDEFNEFSEPEDMMEDLRKEVEKVVETIEDNECLSEATWNYQVTDQIEEHEAQPEELQLYSDNLNAESSLGSHYDEIDNADNVNSAQEPTDSRNFDSEDDDDDKPLEQVRQSLQKSIRVENDMKKFYAEEDKEDLELTECLKKIHNFKCGACNKAFNSRTALGYHLKTHTTERRYVCDQCGKKFLTNGALKVHQRLHTDDRPYECKFPDCGKSFRQWGDLKYHETSIHSDKKDHVCEFCAKAFARKYSLVIHRRIHTGERNYKCTDCDKSFRASSYLLNHKRIHTGEKPYSCNVVSCQKKFRVVGDLKRHMKIHERSKVGGSKEKKKEVVVSAVKKETLPQSVIVTDQAINLSENPNDECVDLSFKEQDKSSLVYTNNEIDIYAKHGRATVKAETAVPATKSPKKSRKASKSRKGK